MGENSGFYVGVVEAVDAAAARARVRFDDIGITSDWIPVAARSSKLSKERWPIDEGEHVCCMMDARCERGVVLCAIYSEAEPPPVTNNDKYHVQFSDGTTVEYDRATHTLALDVKGPVTLKAAGSVTIEAQGQVAVKAPSIAMLGTGGGTQAALTGNFTLVGNLNMTGNLATDGNISATGTITDTGGNTNHHTH
jgi:phage baseplate assembly protein V